MDMSKYASDWLNADQISTTDLNPTIATIMDEGTEQSSKFDEKKHVVFTIEINGSEYKYKPSRMSIRNIIKMYGADSMNYPGKKLRLIAVPQLIKGEMRKIVVVL